MVSILLGVVLALALMSLANFFLGMGTKLDGVSIFFTVVVGIMAGFMFALIIPSEKYEEAEVVESYKLVSLSSENYSQTKRSLLYVSSSVDNVYTYRYELENGFGTETSKSYKVETLDGKKNNVIENEDVNCEQPQLIVYRKKAVSTIWNFGIKDKITYVFYVPEGTIKKNISLD